MEISPTCPNTHTFDKNRCLCIPKNLEKTQKVKPECKPGKQKNANGRCVKIRNTTVKLTAKPDVMTTVIPNIGTVEEKMTSKMIMDMVSNKNTSVQISTKVMSVHSFSPSINKRILSLHNSPRENIFQCNDSSNEVRWSSLNRKSLPLISIGTGKDGKAICKPMDSKKGKEILLRNIRNTTVDENQIITPVQRKSNCWFNTFFVTFFISDKGRKFFRYFREMMVTGNHADGTKIKPQLAKSLLLLNACIEASYGNQDIAMAMDTNNVISNIYDVIPSKKYNYNVKPVGRSGNPWNYYKTIMRYMNNNDIKYLEIDKTEYNEMEKSPTERKQYKHLPELLVCVFYDDDCKDMKYQERKQMAGPNGEIGLYVLDSAIVRDTKKRHFCALITINGNKYGFDGVSHSRMIAFDWKKHIFTDDGVKSEWTFEGSIFNKNKKKPIKWSFSSAVHMLFYYRVQ